MIRSREAGEEHAFELSPRGAVIGRGADCDVRLPAASVSLRHAQIVLEGAEPFVVELGSTNGTALNGRPLPAEGRVPIRDGDRLEIGVYSLRFSLLGEGGEGREELARHLAREILSGKGDPAVAILNGPQAGLRAVLGQARQELVIGRGEDCDLCLIDAGASRRHAAIRRSLAGAELIDLGSRHGTTVDAAYVPPGAAARLHDRSEILVGQTRLAFSDPEEALLASLDGAEPPGATQPLAAARPATREAPTEGTGPRLTRLEAALLIAAGIFFVSGAVLLALALG
jgi:pSer/pThr/pTyr-binding forkhead associated (FHA) protein